MRIIRVITLIDILCLVLLSCTDKSVITNKETITSQKGKLYIITKNWGLTSDKQITIITTSDENTDDLSFDSTAAYVYEGLSPFVYFFDNDTLFVYSATKYISPKPSNFRSFITVVQRNIDDPDYIDIRSLTEKEKGKYKSPGENLPHSQTTGIPVPPPPPSSK